MGGGGGGQGRRGREKNQTLKIYVMLLPGSKAIFQNDYNYILRQLFRCGCALAKLGCTWLD